VNIQNAVKMQNAPRSHGDRVLNSRRVGGIGAALPIEVAALLIAATQEERVARDAYRRHAFAVTRLLIGGAHNIGYRYSEMAGVLGVSSASVRNRNAGDGAIPTPTFAHLIGLPTGSISEWRTRGLLPAPVAPLRQDGAESYLASDLIRALTLFRS
jgi:hypothetical protein